MRPFPAIRCIFLAVWLLAARGFAQNTAVQFIGAAGYPPETLKTAIGEQLLEIEQKGLTPPRADDAAFFLGNFYRKEGYARVDIAYEVRGKTLVLRIKEGPRTLLRSLRFAGNKVHTETELAEYFAGVPAAEIAAAKIAYNEAEISAGGDRVRGFYLSEGWLDVAVDAAATRLSPDGTAADVVVTIAEGLRYTFGEVTFTGTAPYARTELIEALGAKPEGAFTPSLADAMAGSLKSWLRSRGHFNAQVTVEAPKEQASKGRVPVKFIAAPGPKFRVTAVTPRGLDRVTPEFIQQRFSKITDATYDPAAIDEKYRELLRTGMFRTLRIAPREDGPGRLRLELEIEEAKQKEFGFEIGYGTYDGFIAGIRMGDRNFLRTGRPLTLSLETSQRGFEGELLYVDQWFADSDWTLRARLYSQFRDEEGYSKSAAGVRVDLSRKISSRWEISAFSEFAFANISSDEIDPLLLGPLNYQLTSLGVAQKLDYRDNPLNPTRGFVFTTSLELDAIDGEFSFSRLTARYSHYRKVGRSLLALGLRTGWIIPAGDALDVPIDLRYFNGGGNSVRSFAERDLGPKDSGGHPLGGNFFTIANIEWDFPITEVLTGAVFVDAGNLTTEASPSFDDMRYAIGAGLRYQLPIGPMRLDYGYNPSRREGEDAGAIHFSFGFAF